MTSSSRRILTHNRQGRSELRELFQGLFASELIKPSSELWIVSPWISNIALINDESGRFRFLHDSGETRVRLITVIAALARRGSKVHVVTRPADNEAFVTSIAALQGSFGEGAIHTRLEEALHAKGIAGDGYSVTGSMNLTWSGTQKWDEFVEFRVGPEAAEIRSKFREAYGRRG